MKLKVFKSDGSSFQEKEFTNIPTFEGNKGVQALKEVIVGYQANARQGTASTKTKGEVSGSGKKPWRQKGTGMARSGDRQSPLWPGGGIIFGPKPRDYSKKLNKKVRQVAFQRALFDRAVSGEVLVIEKLDVAEPKTRIFDGILSKISPDGSLLLVDTEFSDEIIRSARNIERVRLEEVPTINALTISSCKQVLITEDGLGKLIERLSK